MIQTVTGMIHPSELGICAAHEHLSIDRSHRQQDPDAVLGAGDPLREELAAYRQAGGASLVEVSNVGMGRNVRVLEKLSRASGIRIIAATGFYKEPYLPEWTRGWDRERFACHMVEEVERGIDGRGIWPGVIGEVGSSCDQITDREQAVLEGAALAGRQTGLPVTTHTTLGTMAVEQVRLFEGMGLPPDQLIIGHQDLNRNRNHLMEVVRSGAYVGFDTVGKERYRSDHRRIEELCFLFGKGYGFQILLSADLTRKSHLRQNGGPGYDYLLRVFVPALRAAGFSEQELELMLKENPARAFARRKGESA
ncbi:phosphotriesterase-related protein [Melghirimyces thermohalophilus]|uniref:Phosphotriesterase-related protein n=1 Tax=Melghirimyces thermohalophilus TaxID=1236220 RepID=A0A1G6KUN7_9BACL|nr:phosphotriesterase [Melghirimyces thermohalophilus]SDC34673.1 phosphotriesterase-related protein [Melghirimyces thermohalophilus]